MRHAERRGLPGACGNVVLRGGDYYVAVVNLPPRLVDEAVTLELLVADEPADAASACRFEPAGRRMVKGFDQPVAVRSLRTGRAASRGARPSQSADGL